MSGALLVVSLLAAFGRTTQAATLAVSLDLRDWIVDYQRPTILPRVAPYDLPADAKMDAMLANNSYPAPPIEAYEGDTIDSTIFNHLLSAQVAIVWSGVEVQKRPQSPIIQQGGNGTYRLLASTAGTFSWHASVPAQAAAGLRGAVVIRSRKDPFAGLYTEERTVVLSDAMQRPDVCFAPAGTLVPGCPEIDKVTLNGQWGDGSRKMSKPVIGVQEGVCYRMRFLALTTLPGNSQLSWPRFEIAIQDHSVQLLGDSSSTPNFKVHAGESADVVLCANQHPIVLKDYDITIKYIGQAVGTTSLSAVLKYESSGNLEETHDLKFLSKSKVVSEQRTEEGTFDRSQCDRDVVFDLRDAIVDYLRPTKDLGGKASRRTPSEIPLSNKKAALLVNDTYPGPLLEAIEDEIVCVTVLNHMVADPAAIHWHGQHMKGFPAFDGVYGVTQGAIAPAGGSMTYRWKANVGTHFYHGHMQALQADKGLKGPIVIHAKNDPHRHLYDEEQIVTLSDEWVNPGTCLRSEGAQPGNPVCAEIERASWNGQWGDGSEEYPWPFVTVEQGKCYRLRFIAMMGQAQNFQIQMAGHNMTLIAVDGVDVEPAQVSQFNLHAGERADIVVCANQQPGNYLMSGVYDLATFLETAPSPRMPKVDSSKYWAFLHYKGHDENPGSATKKLLGGYHPPKGTGGGASPAAVAGFVWDTNIRSSWTKVKNLVPRPEPEKADVTYVLDVGVADPPFKPGVTPYATSFPMYMYTNRTPWKKPGTPLLHTKGGECGAEGVPTITVPENATTVEVIINNLSPTAHVLHMHGMSFSVTNFAPFSESWCSPSRFDCFFVPISVAKRLDCKGARLGDPNSDGPGNVYWGCPYNEQDDRKLQFLDNPLQKDMISLFRRSWAVIRFKVENPGVWIFHCHMEQHIPTGQIMAFNLLPSKQPPIPEDVPTEGPCRPWSTSAALRPPKDDSGFWV